MTLKGILTCALVIGTTTPAFAQVCGKPKVLILLDVSGSMLESNGSGTKYAAAKAGIDAALTNLEGKAQFGLMTFPSTASQTNPSGYCWTSGTLAVNYAENNRTGISDFLDAAGNAPKGSNDTPLYQALSNVAYLESQIPDMVLVITDGQQDCPGGVDYGDYNYSPDHSPNTRPGYGPFIQSEVLQNRQDVGDVAAYLAQNNVRVFSIGFSANADAATLNLIAMQGNTKRTPSCTGTSTDRCYYQANNQTELQNTLQGFVYGASPEICNGKDDDCDGLIDEDESDDRYVLSQQCAAGCGLAQCTGAGDAAHYDQTSCRPITTEICNNIDDNCDGQIDENLADRACGDGGGTERCINGDWVAQGQETCDGKDNDCNGLIDDGITCPCQPGQTEACGYAAVGACESGTKTCAADYTWGSCEGGKGPSGEICNGIDDDCDGIVDNIDATCTDCNGNPGTQVCLPGGGTQCQAKPAIDFCDGKDNNCNGQIDEDGDITAQGQCGLGREHCVNGTLAPIVYDHLPQEVCNGHDDNCDGHIDENCGCAHGTTKSCDGVCGNGIQKCEFGRWTECIGANNGVAEVCDGQDQNCNGQVDEEAPCPNAGESCLCGQCVPPCNADGSCSNGAACINGMCELGACSMGPAAAAAAPAAPAAIEATKVTPRTVVKGGCDCSNTATDPSTLLAYTALALLVILARRRAV